MTIVSFVLYFVYSLLNQMEEDGNLELSLSERRLLKGKPCSIKA